MGGPPKSPFLGKFVFAFLLQIVSRGSRDCLVGEKIAKKYHFANQIKKL